MEAAVLERARHSIILSSWRLQLTIPSVLASGEEFSLRITAIGPDGLPSGELDRELVFDASPGIEGLPNSVRISPADGGQLEVDGLQAVGPQYAFVVAHLEGGRAPFVGLASTFPSVSDTVDLPASSAPIVWSNPAWVMRDPPYRIFWGDLHVHTTHSNCSAWACKDPEFCLAYARDVSCLHFAAAADHLRGIAADPGRWPHQQQLVRAYDLPGRFVPFLAFESSHKAGFGGDNNAYYLGWDAPFFWIDRPDMKGNNPEVTLQQLWDFLDQTGKQYFTIPHHSGRAAKYRSYVDAVYDAKREPLFEIYSAWGSSESRDSRFPLYNGSTDQSAYLVDALKAGCRYGVIASGDDHVTMPGGEAKNWSLPLGHKCMSGYIHRGLAAVRAPELTRESLWGALLSRNCYGTTFARTLLDFHVGDVPMGQEAMVSRHDRLRSAREIRVNILSTEPGSTNAVLVRNGQEIARKPWSPEQPQVVFTDTDGLDAIAIRHAQFHPEPFVVYYIRLESQASQVQWSSPVWLDLTNARNARVPLAPSASLVEAHPPRTPRA